MTKVIVDTNTSVVTKRFYVENTFENIVAGIGEIAILVEDDILDIDRNYMYVNGAFIEMLYSSKNKDG